MPDRDRMIAASWPRLTRPSSILGLLIGVGFLLRIFGLGDKSLWLDEAFSYTLATRDPLELVALTARHDAHPPLYYLLLHFWLGLGTSEAHLRLLSVVAGTAAIPAMYLVGRRLFGETGGLVAAAILTFSPFHIWYSQEVRMYALLSFLLLVTAYYYLRGLQQPDWQTWVRFGCLAALSLFTDNGAVWFLGALFVYAVVFIRSRAIVPYVAGSGLGAALYLPWLPTLVEQTNMVTSQFWVPAPGVAGVLDALVAFTSRGFPWDFAPTLFLTAAVLWGLLTPERDPLRKGFPAVWLVIPIAAALLLSLKQPIFLARNLIAASLGLYLLYARAAMHLGAPRSVLLGLAPLFLMNLVSVGNAYLHDPKEDWRGAAGYVAQRVQSGDQLLFVASYGEIPFSYYSERTGLALPAHGFPIRELLLDPNAVPVQDLGTTGLAGARRIWLVVSHDARTDPQGEALGWLSANAELVDQARFHQVGLHLYQAREAAA